MLDQRLRTHVAGSNSSTQHRPSTSSASLSSTNSSTSSTPRSAFGSICRSVFRKSAILLPLLITDGTSTPIIADNFRGDPSRPRRDTIENERQAFGIPPRRRHNNNRGVMEDSAALYHYGNMGNSRRQYTGNDGGGSSGSSSNRRGPFVHTFDTPESCAIKCARTCVTQELEDLAMMQRWICPAKATSTHGANALSTSGSAGETDPSTGLFYPSNSGDFSGRSSLMIPGQDGGSSASIGELFPSFSSQFFLILVPVAVLTVILIMIIWCRRCSKQSL